MVRVIIVKLTLHLMMNKTLNLFQKIFSRLPIGQRFPISIDFPNISEIFPDSSKSQDRNLMSKEVTPQLLPCKVHQKKHPFLNDR